MSAVPPFSEAGVFFVTDGWYQKSPGVYVGMIPNDSSIATAQQNAVVLQTIINLAQNAPAGACPGSPPFWGATIVFPGHFEVPPPVGPNVTPPMQDGAQYFIALPASPQHAGAVIDIGCNWPLRLVGTGNVQLAMVSNSATSAVFGDMFFDHSNTGSDMDIGGITFEDLQLSFANGATTFAAVHVAAATGAGTHDGGQNVRLNRVVFDL